MAYPIKKDKQEKEWKEEHQTYSFIFKHKDCGFEDYEKDKFEIENKIRKQLEEMDKFSDKKTSIWKIETEPFAEDTKVNIEFKNVDRKTAEKIAGYCGWKII